MKKAEIGKKGKKRRNKRGNRKNLEKKRDSIMIQKNRGFKDKSAGLCR